MYRRFAGHLLAIAFIIYVAAAIVAGLLSLAGVVGSLLASIVELFAAFLLQATLVKAVQDIRDGRADLSIGETMSSALPYIWSVAGASILAGIAITIGLILIIVPGLWLITIWAVIIPVIIIERSGALNSFGRSRQLVRGHGWHVFGTLVLVFIILIVVDIVLGIIFVALPLVWRNGLSTVISGTLVAPFLALVVTLIYYRLVGAGAGWPSAAAGAAPGGYGTPPGYGPQGGYGTPPPQGGYGTPQDPAAGPAATAPRRHRQEVPEARHPAAATARRSRRLRHPAATTAGRSRWLPAGRSGRLRSPAVPAARRPRGLRRPAASSAAPARRLRRPRRPVRRVRAAGRVLRDEIAASRPVDLAGGPYDIRPIGWVDSGLSDRDLAPRHGDESAPDAWLMLGPQAER